MQSLESRAQAGCSRPVETSAPVGHASMHWVQVPQRSGGGVSGSSASETSNSPRKNQEPAPSRIRQVFLPIQPRPALRA